MNISANFTTARRVALQRACGARDAANAFEARSDEMPGDVAKQLMKHHADGFNAFITDAVTDTEVLNDAELSAEIQARIERMSTPPRTAAERTQAERKLTEQIREECTEKKEYADEAVQVHTGALNHLDALIEGDHSRLRRAGSLNRIVRRMKNDQATANEFSFFHDPSDRYREFADRTPFDLGYGLVSKRPELMPAPDAAAIERSARDSPHDFVTQTVDVMRTLEPQERLEQLVAFGDGANHPIVFSEADIAAIRNEIDAAREQLDPRHGFPVSAEHALSVADTPTAMSPAASEDLSLVGSLRGSLDLARARNDSPPPLQRRNAIRIASEQPQIDEDFVAHFSGFDRSGTSAREIIGLQIFGDSIVAHHANGSRTVRSLDSYSAEHPDNRRVSASIDWNRISPAARADISSTFRHSDGLISIRSTNGNPWLQVMRDDGFYECYGRPNYPAHGAGAYSARS